MFYQNKDRKISKIIFNSKLSKWLIIFLSFLKKNKLSFKITKIIAKLLNSLHKTN